MSEVPLKTNHAPLSCGATRSRMRYNTTTALLETARLHPFSLPPPSEAPRTLPDLGTGSGTWLSASVWRSPRSTRARSPQGGTTRGATPPRRAPTARSRPRCTRRQRPTRRQRTLRPGAPRRALRPGEQRLAGRVPQGGGSRRAPPCARPTRPRRRRSSGCGVSVSSTRLR